MNLPTPLPTPFQHLPTPSNGGCVPTPLIPPGVGTPPPPGVGTRGGVPTPARCVGLGSRNI